jgi:hypothetical protein
MRNKLSKIALAATLGFAITFTLYCTSDNIGEFSGNDASGTSEGVTYIRDIENITGSSFIEINKEYYCESGILIVEIYKDEESYSINGKTLSLWGLEFNGNSTSLIGTWTREPFSTCEEYSGYSCEKMNGISKVVFTRNSRTITECLEKEEYYGKGMKEKAIDCNTLEVTNGTETVIVKYSGEKENTTYNGKTCTNIRSWDESKYRKACTDAYNSGGSYEIILKNDQCNCLKDNKFPEWYSDEFCEYRK